MKVRTVLARELAPGMRIPNAYGSDKVAAVRFTSAGAFALVTLDDGVECCFKALARIEVLA